MWLIWMSIFRNLLFAIVSVIALNLIYWAYTQLLVLIVGWFLTLSLFIAIIIYVVFGGLIFGVSGLVGSLLAAAFMLICRIAKSGRFSFIWSVICIIICVIGSCIGFWPAFVSVGVLGVIGALLITADLIVISIAMCSIVAERVDD